MKIMVDTDAETLTVGSVGQSFGSCVICGSETISTVEREEVPTLQNRVYSSASDARAAKCGRLDVQVCRCCGHAFNAAFNPALLEYDEHYDNDVPSPTFDDYYRGIAAYLRERYLPRGGVVLDIGFGKGKFLQILTGMFADIQGIGIDPSCRAHDSERLKLVTAIFPQFVPAKTPDLVICRHTLEHIVDPVPFVRAIAGAVSTGTPVFFEVPDAAWIVRNRAFWDWCYEHVNYFVAESAIAALTLGDIEGAACASAFGGQYLWIEGVAGKPDRTALPRCSEFAQALLGYTSQEREYVANVRNQVLNWKQAGNAIVVWGMSTKGIEFVSMVDCDAELVDYCVDINKSKQNRYIPLSARPIRSPEILREVTPPMVVIVMNPCYLEEIRDTCLRMSVDAQCVTL